MSESGSVRVAFETARLRLSEIRAEGQQARQLAYRSACERSARTLNVERVSIWFLDNGGGTLSQALQYTLSSNSFTEQGSIQRRDCGRYFDALLSRRVVAATDALNDPRTSQLEPYLRREGVRALLDAPIYRDGQVVGVVCHEHVGGPRDWSEREAGFASAVADLLTILIHQAERAELRAALDAQRELQVRHAKMEALVRMGRVVTHDLANVLLVASLRAGELSSRAQAAEASEEIVQVLDYGTKLLGQLRDFCYERASAQTVEAVALIRGLEPALRVLLGKSIDFRLECTLSSMEVHTSGIELEQLLLNLCMNAKDAVGQQGTVTVSLGSSDEGLLLEVRDDGCGMDEETQLRLFEPFYTTKRQHSGVGLSAVYGIVQRANGKVAVHSRVGEGTTFRITLPPTSPRAVPEAPGDPWEFQ